MVIPTNKGFRCSECGQFVKLYKRKMTSAMAYGLILIYKHSRENKDWVHIENYFKKLLIPSSIRGDISKLRFWNLLEKKKGERADGSKRTGYYKITELGKRFVEGKTNIPTYIKLYNNKFYGFEGNLISIRQALKNKFNYSELMEN